MPRLLITNNHLANYGGSEMVTLEIVEEFVSRGWEVDVYANLIALPFQNEFRGLLDSGAVRLSDEDVPDRATTYDLLWVQHAVLPDSVIEALITRGHELPLVWNHMSTLPSIESPVLGDIEASVASVISYNSEETRRSLRSYDLPEDVAYILPNPSPRDFVDAAQREAAVGSPKKVLLVSNHPPKELLEAAEELALRGATVEQIGGEQPRRVTAETFEDIDAVITIGKSAQYALCLGLPVYLYDHLGGNGWLTAENCSKEGSFNFSGRPERRKIDSDELVEEFLDGYESARHFSRESVSTVRKHYSLERHIDSILETAHSLTSPKRSLPASYARRWQTFALLQRNNTRVVARAMELDTAFRATLDEVDRLRVIAARAEAENDALRHSRTFKIGSAVLKPIRFLRRSRRS